MDRKRIALIVLAIAVIAGGLWLKSYFSPTNVIRRALFAAIEAFEQEQILAAISPISRSYDDRWGMSYESLAGNMRTAMDTYDDLRVDLEPPRIAIDGETATASFAFILWGSYEGTRGYVIGSLAEPCSVTLAWRKEAPGWRIVSTEELDIPELREELEEMESR
jgi:hypothetical protein